MTRLPQLMIMGTVNSSFVLDKNPLIKSKLILWFNKLSLEEKKVVNTSVLTVHV